MPSSRSASSTLVVVALSTFLVAVAMLGPVAVSPAAGAPPPEDVCGACETHFETAVEDVGRTVTVDGSSFDVWVFENGSAWVVAENQLRADDAAWVDDHREEVVDSLAESDDGLAPVTSDATVRVVHDRVYVAYAVPNFAHTSVGNVVLVDAFRDTHSTGWEVNADTFRLYAPGDYVFTAGPDATEVNVWGADSDPSVDTTLVAFAPDDGVVSTLATQLAIGVEVGPPFAAAAALTLAVPFFVLAIVLALLSRLGTRVGENGDIHRGAILIAGASAVLAVAMTASGIASDYFMLPASVPLFVAATGVVVGGLAARGYLADHRRLAVVAIGTPLAFAALAAAIGALRHPELAARTAGRALASGLLAAQLWLFAPLGSADRAEDETRWWLRAAAFAPFVGFVLLLGPGVVFGVFLAVWALALGVVAAPAYWIGSALQHARVRSV